LEEVLLDTEAGEISTNLERLEGVLLDTEAGEISTDLKRLEGILMDREGWRNIHKLRKA
jgi:hypothetical protein